MDHIVKKLSEIEHAAEAVVEHGKIRTGRTHSK